MGFTINVLLSYFSLIVVWFLLIFFVQSIPNESSTYIVHMDKSLMPKVFIGHNSWYSSIVDSLKFANPNSIDGHESSPSLIYTYDYTIHGFSAILTMFEVTILKKSLGFISASRGNRAVKLQTTYSPEFLSLDPSFGIWPNSKYGDDVIIGVIDSGIWPESLSFNDDGMTADISSKWRGECEEGEKFNSSMCNLKLIGVKYFNKGLIKEKNLRRVSMNSARDNLGHGTFVSSIVAGNNVSGVSYFGYANGTAKGIAPHARLAIYKVMWEEGTAEADVLAGIESAIADGVDVINISIAVENSGLLDDPVSIGSFAAMKNGIVVSCAAGNFGPAASTVLNGYPWVITVTAGTTDRLLGGYLILGNGIKIIGRSVFIGTGSTSGNSSLLNVPIVYNRYVSPCNDSVTLTVFAIDHVVVCDPGYNIQEQTKEIISSNVLGAILISDGDEELISYPYIIISTKDAMHLISYLETVDNPLVSMTFHETVTKANTLAPIVPYYASRGPSHGYAGIVKPDVIAPGSQVLGAWSRNTPTAYVWPNLPAYNDYSIKSGTSVASPHVAGLAALLKSAHPEWSPAAIRSAIITTANPFDNSQGPIRDGGNNLQLASPLAMGSGMISPNRALDPGLIYDIGAQDYINLLCAYLSWEQILVIDKSGHYNCTTPSNNLNYPSFLALYRENRNLTKKFERTVTNVGIGTTTYNVVVKAPPNSTVFVSPDTLIFERANEKKSFSVTINYKGNDNKQVSYGELVWVEQNRQHKVRSPIVVSPI